MSTPINDEILPVARKVCYRCMRPAADCYCSSVPRIQNQIPVLIFQHRRERPHPFNTARMVQMALENSRLIVERNTELARVAPRWIRPNAGLLYPTKDAIELSNISPGQRPEQLIILDGTWHHAKTLYRDITALHALPKYKVTPKSPGNYRIRREPTLDSLSTLEATVAAVEALEPDTHDVAKMIECFNGMIERQLAYPKNGSEYTHRKERKRTPINIPSVVLNDLSRIVIAYGESVGMERQSGVRPKKRLPVFWVAQRLISEEKFYAAIQQPNMPMNDSWLEHLELKRSEFGKAHTVSSFRDQWRRFLNPDDIVVVYNPSTLRLLENIDADFAPSFNLKTVHFDPERKYSTLEQFYSHTGHVADLPVLPGRAGKRLANVKSFVMFLNDLGSESVK